MTIVGISLLLASISPLAIAREMQPCEKAKFSVDTDGTCPKGFRLNPDGKSCSDINQCTEGSAECSHICNNFCGGYACSCPKGMRLGDDGITCHHEPIDCVGHWTEMAECSTTCGCGIKKSTFIVTEPAQHGGTPCEERHGRIKAEPCRNQKPCPLGWAVGAWNDGPCNATCGNDGYRTRTRKILRNATYTDEPMPELEQFVQCDLPKCPVDCVLSGWKESECSASCGHGTRMMYRDILAEPMHGGQECTNLEKPVPCFLQHCPVNLKMWEHTDCEGSSLESEELKKFGSRVQGSPDCRIVDEHETETRSMGQCAFKCQNISDCSGFVYYEDTRKCCFKIGTLEKTPIATNVTCFEMLDEESKLRPTNVIPEDESYFWSVVSFMSKVFISIGTVFALSQALSQQSIISKLPVARGEEAGRHPPEADPSDSSP